LFLFVINTLALADIFDFVILTAVSFLFAVKKKFWYVYDGDVRYKFKREFLKSARDPLDVKSLQEMMGMSIISCQLPGTVMKVDLMRY
jgi:hypothetical protein